ncbi:TPR-like protein [Delitschia confertaspora ATCC 74209]|uniref:TPR-like protein n=1 Tax=Delitschia confertaspora ATCC 74209 TaxID=1513339 RepID=A0A9P4JTZ8_9PLEO|nr:TPR-like protein [Delitschia confertaspora ATCC 74209]
MSNFHGNIDGRYVIAGTHTAAGGTTNFNINYHSGQDRSIQKPKPFSTLPFAQDPDFVDRPEILGWIRDKCAKPGSRAALVGLGGIGKSQIALRYCYDVCDTSPQTFVFWINASTKARFEEAYRHIANKLELPGRDDPEVDVLQLVSNWLCDGANGQWTMVLDNVENTETFFPSQKGTQDELLGSLSASLAAYLPQSRNGSILITSRNKYVAAKLAGGHHNTKQVRQMNKSQGLQLLQTKLPNKWTQEGAADLLHTLDYIPLAVTQAAAYINQGARMTISRYLDEFRSSHRKRENLLNWDAGDLRQDKSASQSVMTTWHISFERVRAERPSAADLLLLMSFFNPQGIPESILRRHSENTAESGSAGQADSTFDKDFDILHAYSLIEDTAEPDMCKMHALVQFCTQDWLSSSSDPKQWKQKFIKLMSKEFSLVEFANWAECRQLLPHIESLCNMDLSDSDSVKQWVQVLNNAGRYIQDAQGKYNDAERLIRRALHVGIEREKELGIQHPNTLTSMNNLADVLRAQGKYYKAEKLSRRALEGRMNVLGGKYNEAEKLSRRALEGRLKELGVQHLDTLGSMNSLASILQFQGRFKEAEKLSRRALEGREKKLGVEHPDTLKSMSNLAVILWSQGKYKEAEKLNQRALEGFEKELRLDHPDTLRSVGILVLVLWNQGEYREAEKLSWQALKGFEKELGPDHPDTLRSMNSLAYVLQTQGKYKEAEKLNRRALEGYKKELGVQHPDTLTGMSNLAAILLSQGKYKEAGKLSQQALEGYKKELGVQHPNMLRSMNILALALQNQGKYNEAEKLNRRALEGYKKELGVQHPDTLTSMSNLAAILLSQGKYKEAEKLIRQALEGYEKELGVQYASMLRSVSILALVLQYQGKYNEAEKLNRRALEGYKKELGVQHPDTLRSMSNLASILLSQGNMSSLAYVLQTQGKYKEAEKLNRRALEGYKKELGVQHPDTLTSMSNLAEMLLSQGKYKEAEKLSRQALEGYEKELGVQHPNMLRSMKILVLAQQYQGKYNEAEKLNRQVLERYEKELGAQHPDTLRNMNNLALVLRNQGKYKEAEKLNRWALEGFEKELGLDHPDTLDSVYHLAYLLHLQKRYKEASEPYQRACEGYQQKLGQQHPTTIACMNNYAGMQQTAERLGLSAELGAENKSRFGGPWRQVL